jgi:hypothetical protein
MTLHARSRAIIARLALTLLDNRIKAVAQGPSLLLLSKNPRYPPAINLATPAQHKILSNLRLALLILPVDGNC